MELKELTERTIALFEVESPKELSKKLLKIVKAENDVKEKYFEKFVELVGGDLETDWLQMIYQYYLADREKKKQDYTPSSLAALAAELVGQDESIVDMCAGTGALTIKKWGKNKEAHFILYELDMNVIPLLLFNLMVRNIDAVVYQQDILYDEHGLEWHVKKGEKYGTLITL